MRTHNTKNLTAEQEAELKKQIEQYRALKIPRMNFDDNIKEPAYIVSKKWLKKWKKYIGAPKKHQFSYNNYDEGERIHPGPITNKEILEEDKDYYKSSDADDIYNVVLKPEMREHFEFRIINSKQWKYLYGIYGGKSIRREQYRDSYPSTAKVEVYFHPFNLIILPSRDNFDLDKVTKEKTLYCSKRWSSGEVQERIVHVLNDPRYGFNLEKDKFRMWKLEPYGELKRALIKVSEVLKSQQEQMETSDDIELNTGIEFPGVSLDTYGKNAILSKMELGYNDKIIIELPNQRGEYIFKYRKKVAIGKCEHCYNKRPIEVSCECNEVHYCSLNCKKKDVPYHKDKCSAIDTSESLNKFKRTDKSNMGITGLQNLGNTCFMNSGLQCLSNTWQLSKYFLNDLYVPEINKDNPLGMKGKMAFSFAKLVKMLWYDTERYVSPWDLKKVLGKRYTSFCGFSQQDSQELISAILDALHEDLNRVKVKSYVEQKTTDDPNDNSAKNPSWYNFLARNKSIIIDLFYGQYKSILQCPICQKYSITFDPFSVVSLPVPQDTKVHITVHYVSYSFKKKIIRTVAALEREATVDELRNHLVETLGIKKFSTIFYIASFKGIEKVLGRNEKLGLISKYVTKNRTGAQDAHLIVQEINPKYWGSPDNIGIKPKMEEDNQVKKENINGSHMDNETLANKEDYNNGLIDDLVKVPLSIFSFEKSWGTISKKQKTFVRVLYTKKSFTLKELHMEVFRYLRPLFEKEFCRRESPNEESKETPSKKELEYSRMSDETLFKKVFPELTEENWEGKRVNYKNMPYALQFVNVSENYYFNEKPCFYCDKKDCNNCLVPFSSKVTVGDMINKLGVKKIDSLYAERPYQKPRCLMLELTFNEDEKKAIIVNSGLESMETAKTKTDMAKSELTIYDCLNRFVEWETLDRDNFWYCPFCKDSVAARKKFEFTRAPPILVFHLKRFRTTTRGKFMGSDRLNNLIDFPLTNLDFTPYLKGANSPVLYDLYAVSNHYGSTGFGHYTAFAWNDEREGWYQFDDRTVDKEDPKAVCSTAAYILFYRRKDIAEKIDYERIRQEIPADYKVPVVDLTKGKNKTETKKPSNGMSNQ
jgi:ubiquitin carboxyl-terminal hydrolase 4/11/15